MVEKEYCPICQRHVRTEYMTIHHYQPKSQGGTIEDTIRICKCCHENLHYYIDIDSVPFYDTVTKLEQHHKYGKYINFIRTVEHTAMYSVRRVKNKLKEQIAA